MRSKKSELSRILSAARFAIFVAGLLFFTRTALPQYMYLDANGDGRNDRDERVPRLGWTSVDVWLDTASNRDASRTHLAANGQQMAGCSFVVQAGPFIEWGAFDLGDAGMRVTRGPLTDSLTFFVEVRFQRPRGPGRYKLGRIRLKAHWGQGAVSIVPCAVIGELVGTSIRLGPDRREARLGPTITLATRPTIVPGEWHDVDGVSFSIEPRGSAGPVMANGGSLYLGWNRMKPPYDLRIENGRVVVNGFALPEEKPRVAAAGRKVTPEAHTAMTAERCAMAVERALRRLGWSDSASAEGMATAYRVSSTVDSVRVTSAHSLQVFPKGSYPLGAYGVELRSWEGRRPATDPDAAMASRLEAWSRSLNLGCLLQVYRLGHELCVPSRVDYLDRAVESLQRGERLSAADSSALRSIARTPEEWEAMKHPVKLERSRP